MATLDQAIEQMRANGMPEFPSGVPRLNTNKIVRYGPDKAAWYRLYETVGRNGRSYVHGAYGMWGRLDSTKVETDWEGIDADQRRRIEEEQREQARREQERTERAAKWAARRARVQWLAARHDGESPYLQRKGVAPEKGLRFAADGTLLVPVIRYDPETPKMVGLQKIAADGTKRFNSGMAKAGGACRIGGKPRDGDVIGLAEGVATALSVREAIRKRHPLFVAFDCGNLPQVAKILREKYPKSPLVLYADDDFLTVCPRHNGEGVTVPFAPAAERPSWCNCNPGLSKAIELADRLENFRYLKPLFADRGQRKLTDFNDLHATEGLDVVERQIDASLAGTPDSGAPGAQRAKKKLPPEFWDKVNHALKHWVLIRGTDTVWDDQREKIVKIAPLRLAESDLVVKFWLANESRRTVEDDRVVFDPTMKADPETHVNLFTGMKMTPAKPGEASCTQLLELLFYLCGEQQNVFDWVLRWSAYPLKHPGAKMATAIVMHGREGAGKGLWWRAMREIYHPYSALITQRELESDFNAWASRKLLVVGNEVVSRQERQHHVGYLKNLVTEETIQINDKHLPIREEANHMQIGFLSNELQALQISPDDRRYLIIQTPPALDAAFYQSVATELSAGGASALYRKLLDLDLGDFNAHSKPIMTDAKRSLIQLGKSSPVLFFEEWRDGLLAAPFQPCLSEHLYRVFESWCRRNGERAPSKKNRFIEEIRSIDGVHHGTHDVDHPSDRMSTGRVQRKCFVVGEFDPTQFSSEADWIKKSASAFHAALGGEEA